MEKARVARLDSKMFPPGEREKRLFREAGAAEFMEIAGYDPEEIAAADPDIVTLIPGCLTGAAMEKLRRCRAVIRMGIGYDKIDVAAATRRGVIVCNTIGYCTYEVAEHAMALLLACVRRLPPLHRSMRGGNWAEATRNASFRRMAGKTLGLCGLGAIGKKIAQRARAFELEVIAHDDYAPDDAFAAAGARRATLDELLEKSDYVCMCCPLNESTRGMIGGPQLARMKETAIFINAARGALADERALADALRRGRIAYAGVDVFEHINIWGAPGDPPDGLYHGIDNILLTPHVAYRSDESDDDLFEAAAGQAKRILSGVWPTMCVNPEVRGRTAVSYRDRF